MLGVSFVIHMRTVDGYNDNNKGSSWQENGTSKDSREVVETMTRPENATLCYRIVSRNVGFGTGEDRTLRLRYMIGPVASVGTLTRRRCDLRIRYLNIELRTHC